MQVIVTAIHTSRINQTNQLMYLAMMDTMVLSGFWVSPKHGEISSLHLTTSVDLIQAKTGPQKDKQFGTTNVIWLLAHSLSKRPPFQQGIKQNLRSPQQEAEQSWVQLAHLLMLPTNHIL